MTTTLDPLEVEKFSRIAAQWWDVNGKFAPLHVMNPSRVSYVRQQIESLFPSAQASKALPFQGLRFLDMGCGGGLLSEPMARLGAQVVGVDASERNIAVARLHAQQSGLDIDYRHSTAEKLAERVSGGEEGLFDVVLNMEVIEHVENPKFFLETCLSLLKPQGVMFLATLNRTLPSFFKAIVGAEYVLRWLPVGTHQWQKFLKPEEILEFVKDAPVTCLHQTGAVYNLFTKTWTLREEDMSVNYLMTFQKTSPTEGEV